MRTASGTPCALPRHPTWYPGWSLDGPWVDLGEEYFHILMLGHKLGNRCQWIPKLLFSPICHVRVVRFCVSSIPSFVLLSSELQARSQWSPGTANASSRSQWSVPYPNSKPGSHWRRSRTANPASDWSLPDPNNNLQIRVVPTGPEQKGLDRSGPPDPNSKLQIECQKICQTECQNICHIECQIESQNTCEVEARINVR